MLAAGFEGVAGEFPEAEIIAPVAVPSTRRPETDRGLRAFAGQAMVLVASAQLIVFQQHECVPDFGAPANSAF